MAATATQEDPLLVPAGQSSRLPTLPVTDHPRLAPLDTLSEKGMAAVVAEVNGIDVSGSGTDRLPVVEISPFSHRQWRPSRSLPDFYDRTATSKSNNSASGNKGGPCPDPAALGLLQQQKATEFGSRSSLNGDRRETIRPRPREGKPVDTSHPGTFVSAIDREKTTIEDMRSSTVQGNQPFICLHKSHSEADLIRRREMQVQGQRMEDMPPKLSMFYMTPWEYYRMHRPYNIPPGVGPTGPAPAQKAASILDELEMRYQALENVYVDDSIYDTFDRSNTLPSIRVTNAPTRRKRNRKQQRQWQQQEQQQQQQPEPTAMSTGSISAPTSSKSPVYRLGVANSLDVLRHFGRPARVENHLTMHLKHTLNQLRRTQDPQATLSGIAMGPLKAPLAAMAATTKPVGLRTGGAPTLGEDMIREGIANNAKKPAISSRNIRAALPSKSAPDVLSRPTTHVRSEIYGHQSTLGGGEDGIHTSRTDNPATASGVRKENSRGPGEGMVSSASHRQSRADTNIPPLSPRQLESNSGKPLSSPPLQENSWAGAAPGSSRRSQRAAPASSAHASSMPGNNTPGQDQVSRSSESQGRRSRVTIISPRPENNNVVPTRSSTADDSNLLINRTGGSHDGLVEGEHQPAAPRSSPTQDPSSIVTPSEANAESAGGDQGHIQVPQTLESGSTPAANGKESEAGLLSGDEAQDPNLQGQGSAKTQESRSEDPAQSGKEQRESSSGEEISEGRGEGVQSTEKRSSPQSEVAVSDQAAQPGSVLEKHMEMGEGGDEGDAQAEKYKDGEQGTEQQQSTEGTQQKGEDGSSGAKEEGISGKNVDVEDNNMPVNGEAETSASDSHKDPNNNNTEGTPGQDAATLESSAQQQVGSADGEGSAVPASGQQEPTKGSDQSASQAEDPTGQPDQTEKTVSSDPGSNSADQSDPNSTAPNTASEAAAELTGDPAQSSRPGTSSETTPPTEAPQLPGAEDNVGVAVDGNEGRRAKTKSAASQGYQGDTVYLTSWDQRTETESVARPETVQTVREDPAE